MMKNGKIMTNVEYNLIQDTIKSHGIKLFGFCNFTDVLPLLPCRAVVRLPLDSKTIIMCAFPYLVREPKGVIKNLSYYASVPDYHRVVMSILKNLSEDLAQRFPNYQFEPFVDSSPIREVRASQLAGLGCVGKNGLLITKEYGSYVFLGEIVTNMSIYTTQHTDVCVGCGKCQKDCPTNSILDGSICEDTCLSAITQKKGELFSSEKSLMIDNHTVWGCDKCQLVCPMNKHAKETYIQEFIQGVNHVLTEDNITKEGAYYWRGKKTILRNIDILK